jgi:hypothetical protein
MWWCLSECDSSATQSSGFRSDGTIITNRKTAEQNFHGCKTLKSHTELILKFIQSMMSFVGLSAIS